MTTRPIPPRKLLRALAAIAAVLPAVTSVIYFLFAGRALRRWLAAENAGAAASPLPPVTFFRPLKADVPELRASLAAHARALRAGDQLLFGAAAGSAAAAVAQEICRAFPQRDLALVVCAPGAAPNPKISKLLQMQSHARNDAWIIADSEARLGDDFLDNFRREWPSGEVLTAAYRFENATTLPQRLDAAAALLTLWPGLALLRAAGRVRLTLGACTALRRADLQAVGGWAVLAGDLAEDHRLGVALAAQGRTIRLSRNIVTLGSDPLLWAEYWRHQRRVAVTYRVANPRGFAGAFFVQGVTINLLGLLMWPSARAALLFGAALFVRTATARDHARRLNFSPPPTVAVVLGASVVETACWALSWVSRAVTWGGRHWHVSRDGKLRLLPCRADRQ